MDCILGGCSSADTTVITNVPWGMVVGAGGVLAVPKGGGCQPPSKTFPTAHPDSLPSLPWCHQQISRTMSHCFGQCVLGEGANVA